MFISLRSGHSYLYSYYYAAEGKEEKCVTANKKVKRPSLFSFLLFGWDKVKQQSQTTKIYIPILYDVIHISRKLQIIILKQYSRTENFNHEDYDLFILN